MKPNNKLKIISVAFALCILGSVAQASDSRSKAKTAAGQPNILFIAIDDMNDWVGYLGGHPAAKTPNMDRLAEKGVNFSNAHCPAPGCSPSRNALLFGAEPFNTGLYVFYNSTVFDEECLDRPSIGEFFKQNGYNTYASGKIHHARPRTEAEWNEYHEKKKVTDYDGPRFDDEEGYIQGKDSKMRFSPSLYPLEDHPDYQFAQFGVDVLKRKHDKPFFLAVGLVKPHLPFVAPKQFFDLYPPDVDYAPRIKKDDLTDIPAVGKKMVKIKDDRKFKQDKAWNKVRRAYLACISWTDFNIGRLLDALEKSPYADNTIVVLWSDHGYALGEKNHFRKFALWEETTRTPFIIWDARDKRGIKGREVKDGVSLINIYRTLADLSGMEVADIVDGFSLTPQLENSETPLAGPAICSWGRGNYTVRTRNWRYTRYYNGGDELYDHKKDSDEWTNQANNPKYADVKKRLFKMLPKSEAPLVTVGLQTWSLTTSADNPLDKKTKGPSN